ncbi:MAG: DUF5666 domain-containing protein [bacterium]
MNDKPKPTLADKISQEITEQKIHMRSKTYFVLGSLALGAGLAGVFLITMFFIGIIFFRLRVHAPHVYLRPDLGSLGPFIQNMPWLPLIVAVVGLGLGIWLLHKYEFSYKKAWKGIMIGFVGAGLVTGFVLDATGLPDQARELEIFRPLIEQDFSGDQWVLGKVSELDDEQITIVQPNGQTVIVLYDDQTVFRPPIQVQLNEFVRVIGDLEDGKYLAEDIIHGQPPRGIRIRAININSYNLRPSNFNK